MIQEVEVLKTIQELICSFFSEEQFTLSFLTTPALDDKIFSCSDTKGSSRRKGMICFEGVRRGSLRFDIRTINIELVPGNVSCHLDRGRFFCALGKYS